MSLYLIALLTHVLVAILGLGSVVCIALIAAAARRTGRNTAEAAASLRPLLRLSAFSLAVMLISGVVMVSSAGGGFHGAWWVRASVLLLLVTGALHGLARRALRTAPTNDDEAKLVLRRVERMAYGMSSLIATITVLMELRPF
jgi:uncharacterized membrane protein